MQGLGKDGLGRAAVACGAACLVVIIATVAAAGRDNEVRAPSAALTPQDPKQPGAISETPGQVPAQHRQAMSAPVTPDAAPAAAARDWWTPGRGGWLPAYVEYANSQGRLGLINTAGPVDTRGHPFFSPLGSNGRACVTCHQPANAMSISVETIQARWDATGGRDPLFAAVDGSNCPSLPQARASSHSLLLDRGLFRIFLPWPPRAADGTPIKPEFDLEVVRDPTGCNFDPKYGLHSPTPMVSVFRRPRPVANMKYLLELPHGVPPHEYLYYNDKTLLPKDPETGQFVSLQLLSDGRDPTLKTQAVDATLNHLQAQGRPTPAQLRALEAFERQVYAAQVWDRSGGALTGAGAPPALGPKALVDGPPGELGNNPINRVFGYFGMWANPPRAAHETAAQAKAREFKASVARGAALFFDKRFLIRDVGQYNNKGLSNPFKRSCASGCHNTMLEGMDLAPGFMDLGTNSFPDNDRPDLPLFRITCRADAAPHAFKGRVLYVYDPGRALITGKCADVGSTMTQQSRGLAARAPYFANGTARSLDELVDFYDRRFNIGYSPQEKRDLVKFLSTL